MKARSRDHQTSKNAGTRSDRSGLAFAAILLVTLCLYLLAMSLPSHPPQPRQSPAAIGYTPAPVGASQRPGTGSLTQPNSQASSQQE
jgi:hypothetical protein